MLDPTTVPTGINLAGAITGYYNDASFAYHAFLRVPAQQDE
jgi:hypothetical protein